MSPFQSTVMPQANPKRVMLPPAALFSLTSTQGFMTMSLETLQGHETPHYTPHLPQKSLNRILKEGC